MKFLADENIPLEVIEYLQQQNINIVSLSVTNPGIEDEEILALAVKENRTIITFDKDFSKHIFKFKKQSKGIIFLRIHPQSVELIAAVLKKLLNMKIAFEESFCVVEPHRVRVVPLNKINNNL